MADDVTPPPAWNPSAPPTQQFINPADGSVFEIYAEKTGEWHIYAGGKTEWVAGGEDNVYESVAQKNAAAAVAPAAPAAAPVATTASSGSTGGTAAPSTGSSASAGSSTAPDGNPPAWNASAPPTEKYINPGGGADDVFEIYAEKNGEWHIYPDKTVWVANQPGQPPANEASYQTLAQQQASVASTGGGAGSSVGLTPGSGGTSASPGNSGSEAPGTKIGLNGAPYNPDLPSTVLPNGIIENIAGPGGGSSGSSGSSDSSQGSGELTIAHQASQPITPSGGNTYTVQPGDNLSGIAEASGVSLSSLEDLNKSTIPNPDHIRPGDVVNLGSGSTPSAATVLSDSGGGSAAPPAGSSGPVVVAATPLSSPASSSSSGSDTGGTSPTPPPDPSKPTFTEPWHNGIPPGLNLPGIGGGTSEAGQGGGAVGFPQTSTYPPVGDDAAKAGGTELGTKAEGWVDGSGNGIPDVAKGVFDVDTHTSTDPLKIDEHK